MRHKSIRPELLVSKEVDRRRQIEDTFWRTSPVERPESDSIDNIVNKLEDAAILLDILRFYSDRFQSAEDVLEIGAGQGWGACMVKRLFPHTTVTASDLSPHAIASIEKWERIFDVKVARTTHCPSDDLDAANSSVDLIFCFAAAHHFVTHRATLREINRVLRPDGRALWFYEPTCSAYLYRAALWRVTRKRPAVPEDVLIHKRIRALAEEVGLRCDIRFYPNIAHRGPVETVYYALLRSLPALQPLLPCTAIFEFVKVGASTSASGPGEGRGGE
jgi:SAM-dependent methyltransferase